MTKIHKNYKNHSKNITFIKIQKIRKIKLTFKFTLNIIKMHKKQHFEKTLKNIKNS